MKTIIEKLRDKWVKELSVLSWGINNSECHILDGKIQAADELLALLQPCVWTKVAVTLVQDKKVILRMDKDKSWTYITTCDSHHAFVSGTPAENRMKYCPYCSGEIEVAK